MPPAIQEPRVLDAALPMPGTFDEFVAPEISAELLRRTLAQFRRRQEVTILFADLRDFTGWVKSTPPEEVAEGLSEYFTEMERAIRRHGGLILQFAGDEIQAVFGAPVPCTAHADMVRRGD